jgi:outer membrane lipoprotein-sorting protein
MKKQLFILSLLIASPAYSQLWEAVTSSDGQTIYSYDPASLKREGDIVTYWELVDYSTPWKSGNLTIVSSKTKIVQDCKNNKFKISDLIDYDGRKGKGNIVNVEMQRKTDWFHSSEGTVNDEMMKLVCREKS